MTRSKTATPNIHRLSATALVGAALALSAIAMPAHAQTTVQSTTTTTTTVQASGEQQQLIDKARGVVQDLKKEPAFGNSPELLRRARAVLIVPNLIKAGFFVGGEGGRGVMMARTANGWSDPAFYNLGSGSFGLQIGVQSAEVVMFVMSDKALHALMNNQVTLGAKAGLAVLNVGSNVEAGATTNMDADVIVWASAQGAYAGVTVEGSVVDPSEEWNAAYYGRAVAPEAILRHNAVSAPGAVALRNELAVR